MVKFLDLNSDRSTIGWSSVSSQTTRKQSATTATAASTIISVELNQSSSLPRSSITCRQPTPNTRSTRPMLSIGRICVGVSRPLSVLNVSATTTTAIGTLIKKIQPQWKLSLIYPPRIGPQMGATITVIDQSAKAVLRLAGG